MQREHRTEQPNPNDASVLPTSEVRKPATLSVVDEKCQDFLSSSGMRQERILEKILRTGN
jgi:hypothetical protein